MKSETQVSDEIRLEAAKRDIMFWRNNVGVTENPEGRVIRFGLANESARMNKRIKSSDLIGIMSGGIFIAVETKREGWKFRASDKRAVAQLTFIELVRRYGGIAGFCSSVDDFLMLLNKGITSHD